MQDRTTNNENNYIERLITDCKYITWLLQGTYCIWSRDPALPASDNRITANWTSGFSLVLCFFPLFKSLYLSWYTRYLLCCFLSDLWLLGKPSSAILLLPRREREREAKTERKWEWKRRDVDRDKKRWMAVGQSDKKQETDKEIKEEREVRQMCKVETGRQWSSG